MFVVCALYHFATLEDYEELRQPLLDLMERHALRGTLLLALWMIMPACASLMVMVSHSAVCCITDLIS